MIPFQIAAALATTTTISMQRVQECTVKTSYTRVYCDTGSGGGGWTVAILRRIDGSVDYRIRDWVKYEDRFGDLNGEFWIGLQLMHCLTSYRNYELCIDYRLKNGTKSYLHYNNFRIGSPQDQYPLNIRIRV